jgi:excisionase family DNA binding protein
MEKLLTVEEAAEFVGFRPSTIRKWVRIGFIPYLKIGKRSIRFDPVELREWLKKFRVEKRLK